MGLSYLEPSSSELEISKFGVDLFVQVVEERAHLNLGAVGLNEFHVVDLIKDVVAHGLLDEAHGDLLLGLGGVLDDTVAVLVELDDGLHHAHGLVEGAVVIVRGEGVLLQELVLDNLSSLKSKKHDMLAKERKKWRKRRTKIFGGDLP